MRGGRQALLAVAAATLAVTGAVATASTPATSGGAAVTHRLAVTFPDGSSKAESSTSRVAARQPSLRLPTRSRVWFTVPRKTIPSVFFGSLSSAAGRYEAFYFRDLDQGSALLPDPGSSRHCPTILQFGSGFGFAPLIPGSVY